jgi:hypothetical protein
MTIRQIEAEIKILEKKLILHKKLLNHQIDNFFSQAVPFFKQRGKILFILGGAYFTRRLWQKPFFHVLKKMKVSLITLLLAKVNTHIFSENKLKTQKS